MEHNRHYWVVRSIHAREDLDDVDSGRWVKDRESVWMKHVYDVYHDVLKADAAAELAEAVQDLWRDETCASASVDRNAVKLMALAFRDRSHPKWPFLQIGDWLKETASMPRQVALNTLRDLAHSEYGW